MSLEMANNNVNDDTVTLLNDFMNKTWNLVHSDIKNILDEEKQASAKIEPKLRKLLSDAFSKTTSQDKASQYREVLSFYYYPHLKKAIAADKPNHFISKD